MIDRGSVTACLKAWSDGDARAADELVPLVYEELQTIARRLFRAERPGHTLQPTAVVHEAYARLIDADIDWKNRAHFFALAARMMRRILIDYAEKRQAEKRGGQQVRVTLDEGAASNSTPDVMVLELEDALTRLAIADPRKAQLIELQYFGGLSTEEMSVAMDMSISTVGRDLRFARAWLKDQLQNSA